MPDKIPQKHGGAINRVRKGETTNGGRPPKKAPKKAAKRPKR